MDSGDLLYYIPFAVDSGDLQTLCAMDSSDYRPSESVQWDSSVLQTRCAVDSGWLQTLWVCAMDSDYLRITSFILVLRLEVWYSWLFQKKPIIF